MLRVYSVFDRKLREYGPLVLGANDEFTLRALQEIRNSGSMMEKYPADYDLMDVGEFDVETGELNGSLPRLVQNLADVLSQVPA